MVKIKKIKADSTTINVEDDMDDLKRIEKNRKRREKYLLQSINKKMLKSKNTV